MGALLLVAEVYAAPEIISEKLIKLRGDRGQIMVTTVKNDEKLGRPYTVELRVECGNKKVPDWQVLEVRDSESVCDVKAQSPKLTSDGRNISVMIRETDADAFNEQSRRASAEQLGEIEPTCKKKSKEFLFPIEAYCQETER